MPTRVGFIGLGAIGRPMAANLARRFETTVWNRTATRAHAFAERIGAAVAASPPELVEWADVVVTCLPTSREVQALTDAAMESWRDGQLLIDCTSGDPATSLEIATRLAAHGVGFVDAPVSGGTTGAEQGTLTVMCGGDPRHVVAATPVLQAFAAKVLHVGGVGAGHAVKAVNQMLLAVNIQAAGEGLAALAKFGVPAAAALDAINASSGRSNVTENLFPARVVSRAWPRTFRLALMAKDVGIAVDLARRLGTPHEAAATVARACAAAGPVLGDDADHVELVREIERSAGVEIR